MASSYTFGYFKPEGIYVRVYEDRMDLLRAVIVGAYGTPYQDGLFFFDFHLPPEYPDVPPVRNLPLPALGSIFGSKKVRKRETCIWFFSTPLMCLGFLLKKKRICLKRWDNLSYQSSHTENSQLPI